MATSTECLRFRFDMNMHKFWFFSEKKDKKTKSLLFKLCISFIEKQGQPAHRSEIDIKRNGQIDKQ